jgi:MOSC domain-containing protein YiiM
MYPGKVISIHISPEASQPMQSLGQVNAAAGKGLEGDRYFRATGTYSNKPDPARQLTLIELESIEALEREHGIHMLPGNTRRNLVTRDVALNHLVGKEFNVGEALLRGIRLCEPCTHLESLTQEGVMSGLVHRGGLRAEILSGGLIKVGDDITAI